MLIFLLALFNLLGTFYTLGIAYIYNTILVKLDIVGEIIKFLITVYSYIYMIQFKLILSYQLLMIIYYFTP